jgi:hypothetical protein
MRYLRLIVGITALWAQGLALADTVGVVTAASGEVKILRGETYLEAQKGVDLQSQDVVETAAWASAQLDMEDGSSLKLGPKTKLALSEYKLDKDKSVVAAGLDVLSGWIRFAVSKLKKENSSYQFHTAVLTIGVRGTEGVIEAENEKGGLYLSEGWVEVKGVGKDLTQFKPIQVRTGQYIARQRGQELIHHPTPPKEFLQRLPPDVQKQLKHQTRELRQRGVPPKQIRAISKEEVKQYLREHPHMREPLREELGRERKKREGADAGKPPGFGAQVLRERERKAKDPSDSRASPPYARKPYGPTDAAPGRPALDPVFAPKAGALGGPDTKSLGGPDTRTTLKPQPGFAPLPAGPLPSPGPALPKTQTGPVLSPATAPLIKTPAPTGATVVPKTDNDEPSPTEPQKQPNPLMQPYLAPTTIYKAPNATTAPQK